MRILIFGKSGSDQSTFAWRLAVEHELKPNSKNGLAARERKECRERGAEIGMTKLAENDRSAAQEHFRASVATRVFTYFDFDWSGAFLARLEKDPNWPPWIPVKSELSK